MKWFGLPLGLVTVLFAALPATTNYQLNSYGFGSGGAANTSTGTYALEGSSGEISGTAANTTTYTIKPAFVETQQAHVPTLTLDNGSNTFYNKLHFVIGQQNNPTDALYALSISTDNFASDTRYVKSDMTIGSSLVVADYKIYASFGGASGTNIIGLTPNTTYYVRAKATQGQFTESGFGPTVNATTAGAQLSFSLSTSTVAIGSLTPGTVVTGSPTVDITFATNAASGGDVYISSQNGGLASTRTGTSIPATTGDLSALGRGFGAQVTAINASSGTLSKVSPYNSSANSVGIINTTIRKIITATGPIVGGTSSVSFKAKSATTDPAANDYIERSTMLASANF